MKKIAFALLIAATALFAGCCGCDETQTGSTQKTGTPTLVKNVHDMKYSGTYKNVYVSDVKYDGTHYRAFTVGGNGTAVINVTLDSINEISVKSTLDIPEGE